MYSLPYICVRSVIAVHLFTMNTQTTALYMYILALFCWINRSWIGAWPVWGCVPVCGVGWNGASCSQICRPSRWETLEWLGTGVSLHMVLSEVHVWLGVSDWISSLPPCLLLSTAQDSPQEWQSGQSGRSPHWWWLYQWLQCSGPLHYASLPQGLACSTEGIYTCTKSRVYMYITSTGIRTMYIYRLHSGWHVNVQWPACCCLGGILSLLELHVHVLAISPLSFSLGWAGFRVKDADRFGCGGGHQISPRTRPTAQRHQVEECFGEYIYMGFV